MSDFTFGEAQYVHGLWIVLLFVATLIVLDRRGRSILEKFASKAMLPRLVRRPTTTRRWSRIGLLGLTGVFLVGALMRPQWGFEYVETPRAGTELMVCLDVSKSMLAQDCAPNRLERAKAEIVDLLPYLDGDHVGLIAFAGKATVLSPLTPDFGFFRMVLEEAGPNSVPIGGTRLTDPIRKAVAGFGETSDVSRAILLITDGEDHDEFAVDAAEEAAEAGIQIIAIGFGDEVTGSEITVTDPKTGAETLLRDGDGNVVRTKLNGDLLRDITHGRGAYVPAGTGVLDLEAIYTKRLAPLTRGKLDGRGRQIRKEGYQWAILLALVSLLASVFVGSRRPAPLTTLRLSSAAAAFLFGALVLGSALVMAAPAFAQPTGTATSQPSGPANGSSTDDNSTGTEDDSTGDDGASDEGDPPKPKVELPDDPREAHNLGLTALHSGALDTAEEHFSHARRKAGVDVEARYHATYNLAWTHVKRADTVLEEKPEEALDSLEVAADWFRAAIRLRKEDTSARHNLEVVLARILALRDQLAPKDQRDYHQRLDELIERERQIVTGTVQIVEQEDSGVDPEAERKRYRALSKQQRLLISDLAVLARDAGDERSTLDATPEAERKPEDSTRIVQIDNMLHYLNTSSQRLNQGRRQLRLSASEPAFRRCALALGELKRARDQWRSPPELLGTLTQETLELSQYTMMRMQGGLAAEPPPAWLTDEFLEETQEILASRTGELHLRLQSAVSPEGAVSPDGATPPTAGDPAANDPQAKEREKALKQVREAEPFVASARDAMTDALEQLKNKKPGAAYPKQEEALVALVEALERFSDIKRLIETAYRAESMIARTLVDDGMQLPSGETAALDQVLDTLILTQTKNIARADRIAEEIEAMVAELEATAGGAPPGPTGAPGGAEVQEAEKERLQAARQLTAIARSAMAHASEWFEKPPLDRTASIESAERAVRHLADLRRLFFTLVEHMKDTANRQYELSDETKEVAGLLAATPGDVSAQQKLGPLPNRQQELAAITAEIAKALDEQASAPAHGVPPDQAQQMQEQQARLARAAELVHAAEGEMTGAHASLGPAEDPSGAPADPDLDLAHTKQMTAVEQLAEAIALLEPPQQDEQNQDQQQQDDEQQEQKPEEQQQNADNQEVLQAIRDREAEHRKDKAERAGVGVQQVEKDW